MRTRSGIAFRFLFLASLLLGVVAMHQLPVSHGNPAEHGSPAGQHRAEAAQHGAADHRTGSDLHGAADQAANNHGNHGNHANDGEHGKPLLKADHDADHSAMLHLCLAILAAGFLLLAHWWLGTRWPGAPLPLRTASRTRVPPRPPPCVQPCVFRLRVLRL